MVGIEPTTYGLRIHLRFRDGCSLCGFRPESDGVWAGVMVGRCRNAKICCRNLSEQGDPVPGAPIPPGVGSGIGLGAPGKGYGGVLDSLRLARFPVG